MSGTHEAHEIDRQTRGRELSISEIGCYLADHQTALRHGTARVGDEIAEQLRDRLADVNAAATARQHEPGAQHAYRLECTVCGQPGLVRVSVDPQYAPGQDDVYLRDGTRIGVLVGWDGTKPLIEFTRDDRHPGPGSTDLAGDKDTPRSRGDGTRSEAPIDEATPRTRGVEPATYPDPAPRAVDGASDLSSAAPRG